MKIYNELFQKYKILFLREDGGAYLKKIDFKKSATLLGMFLTVQPLFQTTVQAIVEENVHGKVEQTTDSREKESPSESSQTDSQTVPTTAGASNTQSSSSTESSQLTEAEETTDSATKESILQESTTKEKETKESETKESETKESETKESETKEKETKDTEDEFDKLDKANEKLRLEAYAKRPEKDKQAIVNSVPSDVVKVDDVFDTAAMPQVGNSTAHIVGAPNGGDIVFMTDASIAKEGGQSSALWSTQGSKVDMTKPFETEMYVYLGNSQAGAADGMTFTFQNDDRGSKSIGHAGGALGVYGDVDKKRKGDIWGAGNSMNEFIQEGVQKSFTIEMDTSANAVFDGGSTTWFEEIKKAQHILAAYPAHTKFAAFNKVKKNKQEVWKKIEPINQYQMKGSGIIGKTYRPAMKNNAVSKPMYKSGGASYLADGSWHSLKVSYIPQDRKSAGDYTVDAPDFKITFDGKTKDYTGRFAPFQNGLVTKDKPYMYWGMTAATGGKASTQAVAFKNIPKTVGVDHKATIKKDGKSIIDDPDYVHVKTGDTLSYETLSHYAQGDEEFSSAIYSETINENLEFVPGSFQVKENGATEYSKVSDDDITLKDGRIEYKLKHNLSTKNTDFETKFEVKVSPVFYETTVSEVSKLASGTDYVTASQDLTYIIDPTDVAGKVELDTLNDNPEICQSVKGKIITSSEFADQKVSLKLTGDKELAKLDPVEVQLDSKGTGAFEVPFENYLLAEGMIRGTAYLGEKEVVAVGQTEVLDKTAPTAKEVPMDYFQLKKEPKDLPFSAFQLLDEVEDTNPHLSTRDGEDADITAEFKNVNVIKKGLTKAPGTVVDAVVELKDRYENKRELTVPITIVENRLILEAVDSELPLSDIAKRENGELVVKTDEEIQEVIEEASKIKASYIEVSGALTELGPDDFIVGPEGENKGNNFEITGDLLPKVGTYDMNFAVTYNIYDEGENKPVKGENNVDFKITVTDGALSITGSGDLSAETDITTKVQDISLVGAVDIEVLNTNFETDTWTLEVNADPFKDSRGNTGFPLSMIYVDRSNSQELDASNGPVQIDKSSDRDKQYTFSEKANHNFFKLRTASASSNWATKDETYATTLNWTLTGTSNGFYSISDKVTAKGK